MDGSLLDQILDRFAKRYEDETGTIEGGDGTPITLGPMMTSFDCVREYAAEWGCPAGEAALLIDWLPAGLEHTEWKPGELPKEAGVNPDKIPDRSTWVVFPTGFEGVKVYYKRGEQAFPL